MKTPEFAVFTMEFSMPLAEGGSIADAMREILEVARGYGAARTIGATTMDHDPFDYEWKEDKKEVTQLRIPVPTVVEWD